MKDAYFQDIPEMGLLTIVVPVAVERGPFDNLLSWIPEALSKSIEVVVVLDKSREPTHKDSFATFSSIDHPNFIKIEGKYGSPGVARNAGVNVASGKWLGFWDADDLPKVSNYLNMIKQADVEGAVFAVGGFEWKKISSKPYPDIFSTNRAEQISIFEIGKNPGIWRFGFRRKDIKSSFSALRMAEDQLYILDNCNFDANFFVGKSLVYTYISSGIGQQTFNVENLKDLPRSMSEVAGHISQYRISNNSKLAILFLVKQMFSGFKHGDIETKFWVLNTFIRISLRLPAVVFIEIVRSIGEIVVSKLRGESTREVIIPLTGGLGNQFFQLAAGLSEARNSFLKLETSLGAPRLNQLGEAELLSFRLPSQVFVENEKSGNFLMRKASGFMLRRGVAPRGIETNRIVTFVLRSCWKMISIFSLRRNVAPIAGEGIGFFPIPQKRGNRLLYGYFQSYRWPDDVRDELMTMSPKFGFAEVESFRKLAEVEKPLVVHVRLGDYKNESNFGIVSPEYYEGAIERVWDDNKFHKIWAFSDEPEEAKKFFSESVLQRIRWIPELQNSSSLTLEVMRLGHGYVIGNSTYSWWGAYLSYMNSPVVVCPHPWFRYLSEPNDLIPMEWLRFDSSGSEWVQ